MANKLPWFKFYAADWTGSGRVRGLSGDQMAAYVWLLCEQWVYGSLPFDVTQVTPKMPKGISETAVAFVLTQFFPPDPDTNLRRNPKLSEQQELLAAKQSAKAAAASKAREAKARKYRASKQLPDSVSSPISRGRSQKSEVENTAVGKPTPETPVGLPPEVGAALRPYLNVGETARMARVGELRMWVGGMRGSVSEAAIVRGLQDMVVANKPFTPLILRAFIGGAVKLLAGEAGQREALGLQSPVSGQPDANQTPSGGWFAEDEAES